MGDKATIDRKLVVVGDGACGKTCLLIVKAEGTFPKEYVPTVFENHVTYVELPDAKVELALWDTAGQEDYAHIRPLSYDAAHVFLICCSVDNKDSFDNIKEKWVPEIKVRGVFRQKDLHSRMSLVPTPARFTPARLKRAVKRARRVTNGFPLGYPLSYRLAL
jgi:GTPase SAR1 family protein